MKNTRENVLTLLKEMADSAYTVSKAFHDNGNEEMEARSMGQYSAYDSAIRLLTDKKFFGMIWEIYHGGENK